MPATAAHLDEVVLRDGVEKYVAEVCRRCRVQRDDVEDVLQDVLTEICAGKDSFQPEKGTFDTWMHAITWNVVRQHARRSKRYDERFAAYHGNLDEHPSSDASPERCAQRKQARNTINMAARELPDQHFNVIVLHVVDELTHGEISGELGLSEANSQKCYQRARNQLARCVPKDLLAVMPPSLTSCNDSTPRNDNHRRLERSHYIVQVATMVAAFVLACSSTSFTGPAPTLEESSGSTRQQNAAMYNEDKPVELQDEPSVLNDAPSVKPEPASLPSVRNVSTPTPNGDKPASSRVRTSQPSHTFKYKADFSAHRPGNIR